MAIPFKLLVATLVALGALTRPALACNCSCALPGSGSEISSVSGTATLFAAQGRFLYQTVLSVRDVTGSFNELSDWTPKPEGSSLNTFQANLGLTYYPGNDWSLGLLVPLAANTLNGAQWAAQGAVIPFDEMEGTVSSQSGAGLGDISLQASYVAYRGEDLPSLAFWGGLILPSGNATGEAASFTGSGVVSAQLGLSALKDLGPFELSASVGLQRPLTEPASGVSRAFYVGQSFLGQLQANWELHPAWRLGMGASAFYGEVAATDASPTAAKLGKLKLSPSVEWRFMPDQGLRLAYGGDPAGPWVNAMTDRTVVLAYYRFM